MAQRSNLKKVLAILRLLLRLGQYCVVVNFLGHICAQRCLPFTETTRVEICT